MEMLRARPWWVRGSLKHRMRATWLTITLILFLGALLFEGSRIPGTWLTIEQGSGLLALCLTLLFCVLTHRLDRTFGGGGLANRFDQLVTEKFSRSVESASMAVTKQSIFVAISLGLIAFISVRNAPDGEPSDAYYLLLENLELLALGAALLFSLVSILCYDYTHRFVWESHFQEDLLKKALFLDTLAWYSLASGLGLCFGHIHPLALMLATLFLGVLLLFYYFPTDYFIARHEVYQAAELESRSLSGQGIRLHRVAESDDFRRSRPAPRFSIPYNTKWTVELRNGSASESIRFDVGPLHTHSSAEELKRVIRDSLRDQLPGVEGPGGS
ncbi:MAG: hypothetical protein MI919_16875 [Holophagales bacterium]|nr:hypothetical protein [Holophagales bacterium]